MKETITYEKAMQELEGIVGALESGDMEIELLSSRIKRAQELLEFCNSRLVSVETQVKKILNNEQE